MLQTGTGPNKNTNLHGKKVWQSSSTTLAEVRLRDLAWMGQGKPSREKICCAGASLLTHTKKVLGAVPLVHIATSQWKMLKANNKNECPLLQ